MKVVMIVEENKCLRELYRLALNNQGYRTCTYSSGGEALKFLNSNSIDLIILDMKLDDNSCFSVLEKLLIGQENFKIVLTSSNNIVRYNEITWLADAFLEESADLSEMVQTVNNLLSA